MAKIMMTIKSPGGEPSVGQIMQKFGLKPDEIDESFGVVPIDPAAHLFTILVESSAAAKVRPDQDWEVSGPFSNPTIETFGPPR